MKRISLLIVFVFISGCARQLIVKPVITGEGVLSKTAISRLSNTRRMNSLKVLGRFNVSAGGQHRNYQIAVAWKKPDLMRIDIIDQLGGVVATLVWDSARAYYNDPRGESSCEGDACMEMVENLTMLAWSPLSLQRVLTGALPEKFDLNKKYPIDSEGRYLIGDYLLSAGVEELGFVELDEKYKVRSSVAFSEYISSKKVHMPRLIKMKALRRNIEMEIAVDEIEVDSKISDEVFKEITTVRLDL